MKPRKSFDHKTTTTTISRKFPQTICYEMWPASVAVAGKTESTGDGELAGLKLTENIL